MTNGQKAHAVRLHNEGWKCSGIASKIGLEEQEILVYLQSRPGYPNRIETTSHKRRKELRELRAGQSEAEPLKRGERPQPSMPRFRCLEGPE